MVRYSEGKSVAQHREKPLEGEDEREERKTKSYDDEKRSLREIGNDAARRDQTCEPRLSNEGAVAE